MMMGLYESIPLSLTINHINNYDQNCIKLVAAQGIFSRRVIKKLKLNKNLIFFFLNLNILSYRKQKHTNI